MTKTVTEMIQDILRLMKLDQELAKECDDCEKCKKTKTLKSEIIVRSAEIAKLQAEECEELSKILEETMKTLEDKAGISDLKNRFISKKDLN